MIQLLDLPTKVIPYKLTNDSVVQLTKDTFFDKAFHIEFLMGAHQSNVLLALFLQTILNTNHFSAIHDGAKPLSETLKGQITDLVSGAACPRINGEHLVYIILPDQSHDFDIVCPWASNIPLKRGSDLNRAPSDEPGNALERWLRRRCANKSLSNIDAVYRLRSIDGGHASEAIACHSVRPRPFPVSPVVTSR